jgi:hypothetical protein
MAPRKSALVALTLGVAAASQHLRSAGGAPDGEAVHERLARALQYTTSCTAAPAGAYTYWIPLDAPAGTTCASYLFLCYGATLAGWQRAAPGTVLTVSADHKTISSSVYATDPACGAYTPLPTPSRTVGPVLSPSGTASAPATKSAAASATASRSATPSKSAGASLSGSPSLPPSPSGSPSRPATPSASPSTGATSPPVPPAYTTLSAGCCLQPWVAPSGWAYACAADGAPFLVRLTDAAPAYSAPRTAVPSTCPLITPTASPTASASIGYSPSGTPSPTRSRAATPSATPSGAAPAAGCAGVPAPGPFTSLGQRILDYLHGRGEALNITAPAPVKSFYIDYRDLSWSNPEVTVRRMVDGGVNVVLLAFWLGGIGAVDAAGAWGGVPKATQAATIAYAHSKGAVVLVSAGGATDAPYNTIPAATYGAGVAQWAVDNNLDGVDADFENFDYGVTYPPLSTAQTIAWIVDASKAARAVLCPQRLLTHAPQAPYFGTVGAAGANEWTLTSGGYSAVWAATGASVVDGFLVQFYNQGGTCYTTYAGLFTSSASDCSVFKGTSIAEIAGYGVPLNRIVVGKYLLNGADASNGWVSPQSLHDWFATARATLGWNAGAMVSARR